VVLSDLVLDYISRSVLCWLATVDADGAPNVSPKEVFCAHGSQMVLIANIASPTSVRNIEVEPRVCVSFVDVFVQKGYKLKGTAKLIRPQDARYPDLEPPLLQITKGLFPIRSIIAIQVSTVAPIVAPSYRLIAGTTETSQIEGAMRTYGISQ